MKKFLTNRIFLVITTAVICISVTAYAAMELQADQISYGTGTIKDAIDDIYDTISHRETVLWTNPSPTSDFTSQSVAISDDINNYDYVKITFKSNKSTDKSNAVIIEVSDFKKTSKSLSTNEPTINIGGWEATNGYNYARRVAYDNDRSVFFAFCFSLYKEAQANNMGIPLQIIGIKY